MMKTKQETQIEAQVMHNLVQIVGAFPQYTLAQHFLHFLRKKSDDEEPYKWSDEKLLKKVEKYSDELYAELLLPNEED